jgi:hypothetical protein
MQAQDDRFLQGYTADPASAPSSRRGHRCMFADGCAGIVSDPPLLPIFRSKIAHCAAREEHVKL